VYRVKDAEGRWVYPTDHPVGNQFGGVEQGISEANAFPWCIEVTDPYQRALLEARFAEWGIEVSGIPFCPASLLAETLGARLHEFAFTLGGEEVDFTAPFGNAEFTERWLMHGAMNTGIAAFYYLEHLTQGRIQPSPPFDYCPE
jgi:hypothetical protein